jgi:sec-independent protein translocase protein TatA
VFNIGPLELIIILVLALIVFGPQRLPEIGRTVGKSLREVRKASSELRQEFEVDLDDDDMWSGPEPPRVPNPRATSTPSGGSRPGSGSTGAEISTDPEPGAAPGG